MSEKGKKSFKSHKTKNKAENFDEAKSKVREATYNMGALEFERLDHLLREADEKAYKMMTKDISHALELNSALRLIKLYINHHISPDKVHFLEKQEEKLDKVLGKLRRLLDSGTSPSEQFKETVKDEMLEYYYRLFRMKDNIGYGVPFSETYDHETTMRRHLGVYREEESTGEEEGEE